MLAGGGDDAFHGGDVDGIVELAGNAEEVRQVEVADPEDVDAVDRGDVVDGLEAALGLDLGDDDVARVGGLHLRERIAGGVVVVGEREGRAATALRRVVRRLGDGTGLVGAVDHRHHDALAADVEGAGEEMILAARHADHRGDGQAAAVSDLRLDRLKRRTGVLHVVDDVLAAGVGEDLGDAG